MPQAPVSVPEPAGTGAPIRPPGAPEDATPTTLSADLVRDASALARALTAAVRAWGLYPPEHPAAGAAVTRLAAALESAGKGLGFAFGVTPEELLVAGVPLPGDQATADAARLLHDRDILLISFLGQVPLEALRAFLTLVATAPGELRAAGGPASRWSSAGHAAIVIEQIDYERILEDRSGQEPTGKRDAVWQSLVTAMLQVEPRFDALQQTRLLEISQSPRDIGDLATDVIEPKRNIDGSPLITTQAATVLAVFRHLAGIVSVMEPERLPDVMRNVAAATASLDPLVAIQMMQLDEAVQEAPMLARITAAFDDEKVAQLLATALARDGKATARLAQVFDTIAPDEPRKRRVLTMARQMLSEQDFGRTGQFRAVWASMETLLLSYDESPYVSAAYQATLEGAGERAGMLASRDLPPELPAWIESLQQDNVRVLSALLLSDLLRLEDSEERAVELTRDMAGLVDDLLLAGDFSSARSVLQELQRAASGSVAGRAARAALTSVGESIALVEAAGLLGDLDEAAASCFADCCQTIGPTAIKALHSPLSADDTSVAWQRGGAIVAAFGADAAPHLSGLLDDPRPSVHRNAARLLGAGGGAAAVPPLQALLRKGDTSVLPHVVTALAGIDDPSAARAVQTALRAASGIHRAALVEAIVAGRDARMVPMLARLIEEIDPYGQDHDVLLDILDMMRQLEDARAVASVAQVMRRSKWFASKKGAAFKGAAVKALAAIGTPDATAALREAAQSGDRLLKRAARTVSA